MKEKYYKIRKDIAVRGGFSPKLRTEVDGDYLLLSEKDLKMISLTTEEKVAAIGAEEYHEEEVEQEETEEHGSD